MRIQILQLTHSALKLPLALCFSYKRKTQAVSKLLLLLFLSCRGSTSSISLTYLTCCDLAEYFFLFFLILHSFTYFFGGFQLKKPSRIRYGIFSASIKTSRRTTLSTKSRYEEFIFASLIYSY